MFSKFQKVTLGVLALTAAFIWYAIFTQPNGMLTVSFLDVGQGDAIFIETPSGNQILIDGGYGRAVLSQLGHVMPGYDKSIDLVIATHTDSDHLGGLVEVLGRFEVALVIENGFESDSGLTSEWNKLLTDNNIERATVSAGDNFELDDGVFLEILGPVPEDFENDLDEPNEVMIISRLVYGETEFLFTGDIERGDELRLANSDYDLTSDVLKVAHHGSKNSTTDLFLEAVNPQYTIVSSGSRNNYGHPSKETISRLANIGALIFRTDTDGRITFVSDGIITYPIK
jgi:competence protein ComEC